MIHDEQLRLVEVADLPQLFGDLQDVAAVVWHEGRARHPHVLARGVRRCRRDVGAARHDTQGMPSALRHMTSVTKLKPWPSRRTGTGRILEDLLLEHVLFGPRVIDRLRHAVGQRTRSTSALRRRPSPKCVTRSVTWRSW